jgi:hypothetical protein
MRFGFVLAVLGMLPITACVTAEQYVKQGVTLDRYQRDTVGCATKVTQAVPTNTQVAWAPYVGIYSVDTNESLRVANLDICMRDLGYQKVAIPYCQGENEPKASKLANEPLDRSRRLTINENTCYVSRMDGSTFIYTP